MLQDSDWTTQVSENAVAKAKSMPDMDVDDIARAVVDDGKSEYPPKREPALKMSSRFSTSLHTNLFTGSIPRNVEAQLLDKIRDFLDRNLEDA